MGCCQSNSQLSIAPAPSEEVADLLYLAFRKIEPQNKWHGKVLRAALKLNRLEIAMGKEANIITAQAGEIADLKKQLASVPPPPDPATLKDNADLAAEAGFNADGSPVATPPSAPQAAPAADGGATAATETPAA